MNPALLAIGDSSRHMIQILQLLDERRLSLSLAINRLELTYLAGLCILWQELNLGRGSKIVKEHRSMLLSVKKQIETESSAAASEFRVLSHLIISTDSQQSIKIKEALQTSQSRIEANLKSKQSKDAVLSRRKTIADMSVANDSAHKAHQRAAAVEHSQSLNRPKSADLSSGINVDYYPFNAGSHRSMSTTDVSKMALSAAEWECILSDLDHGSLNIFNGIYGGQECPTQYSANTSGSSGYSPQHTVSGYAPIMNQQVRLSPQDTSSEAWSACSSGDIGYVHEGVPYVPLENGFNGDDVLAFDEFDLPQSLQIVDAAKGVVVPANEEAYIDLGFYDGWDRPLMV